MIEFDSFYKLDFFFFQDLIKEGVKAESIEANKESIEAKTESIEAKTDRLKRT